MLPFDPVTFLSPPLKTQVHRTSVLPAVLYGSKKLVCLTNGRTNIAVVWEEGAEENMCTQQEGINRRLVILSLNTALLK